MLAGAARVLRPGGRLLAVTVAPPRSPALARTVERALRPAWTRSGLLAGLRPLVPRPDLKRCGFRVRDSRLTLRGYPSLIVSARLGADPEDPAAAG